jgi:hypothetical protein
MKNANQITDTHLAFRKQMKDSEACAVGERSKHQINLRCRHGSVYSLMRLRVPWSHRRTTQNNWFEQLVR